MQNIDVKNELKETLLKNIPGAKLVSGGKEILTRCHMCLDSVDLSKRHLYIGLGDDTKPPMYHCFLCQESGIVDGRFLRSLNIYDPNLISLVNSRNDYLSKSYGNQIFKTSIIENINHYCNYNNSETNEIKLNYICNRLGLYLSYSDLNKLKIILSIKDFLRVNNITEYTRYPNIMDELENNFIGFLSADNAFINMRNLYLYDQSNTMVKSRYVNYNIFGRVDNSSRFYVLPTKIDISNPNPIEVHIAEGPFDMLSIALNINKSFNHNIYMSIGGNSYISAIRYLIEKIGLVNMNINLYVDNDVDNRSIYYIINYLKPFNILFRVFRNQYNNEKDFGVPLTQIKAVQII